ncbi:flagellar hook-basal body complex protein FliE [Xenorhabdus budapestensis]|uniref:Flagellar hook-basal body complex protein FliE n=1 Tax=Xenorhabdus budapestensis TaxID=290110 RepID=A0A2D0J4C4_XENBU|nr:flagellar hook-basal body complex protein FliE [Xenorhabdus budapestensis]PHM29316.1 flagellar hook-basal body protein FliE [Xenorhabdus budapestensis]QTL38572.1 flagellar hook-basal body complex protein FliE [Xenorhabdus budapestensis]
MSIQAIEGVLQQMQTQALQAGNIAKPMPVKGGFASQLTAAVEKINQNRVNAAKQAQNFTLGVPGVELNDVMVNMQKASISLQIGIQVKNKLDSAYREVMNMQF